MQHSTSLSSSLPTATYQKTATQTPSQAALSLLQALLKSRSEPEPHEPEKHEQKAGGGGGEKKGQKRHSVDSELDNSLSELNSGDIERVEHKTKRLVTEKYSDNKYKETFHPPQQQQQEDTKTKQDLVQMLPSSSSSSMSLSTLSMLLSPVSSSLPSSSSTISMSSRSPTSLVSPPIAVDMCNINVTQSYLPCEPNFFMMVVVPLYDYIKDRKLMIEDQKTFFYTMVIGTLHYTLVKYTFCSEYDWHLSSIKWKSADRAHDYEIGFCSSGRNGRAAHSFCVDQATSVCYSDASGPHHHIFKGTESEWKKLTLSQLVDIRYGCGNHCYSYSILDRGDAKSDQKDAPRVTLTKNDLCKSFLAVFKDLQICMGVTPRLPISSFEYTTLYSSHFEAPF